MLFQKDKINNKLQEVLQQLKFLFLITTKFIKIQGIIFMFCKLLIYGKIT